MNKKYWFLITVILLLFLVNVYEIIDFGATDTKYLQYINDIHLIDDYKLYIPNIENQKMLDYQYNMLHYYHQRRHFHEAFMFFEANWPCYWGEALIGSVNDWNVEPYKFFQPESRLTVKRIPLDGPKWGCGVHLLQNQCIVYSIGSNDQWTFESGLYDIAPHCNIYTFDPTVNINSLHMPDKIMNRTTFYDWGIDEYDHYNATTNQTYYSLTTIMDKLNHKYIDILKIDAEGYEWNIFWNLHKFGTWPSIGQLYIEIHLDLGLEGMKHYIDSYNDVNNKEIRETQQDTYWNYSNYTSSNKLKNWVFHKKDEHIALGGIIELFELHGLRMFHKEINYQTILVSEFSFIQKDWSPNIKLYP